MHPSQKQKILYIITKAQFGGAQRYVYELATAMQQRGHEVVVASGGSATQEAETLVEKLQKTGIRHVAIAALERDIGIFREWVAYTTIRQLIAKEQPDIIHLNSSKAGVLGALAARTTRIGARVIFTAHGWPFREKRSLLWRIVAWTGSWLTALLADHTILVSETDLRATRMPFAGTYSVIHTAVPVFTQKHKSEARAALRARVAVPVPEDTLWLGTIAELTPNKNILTAVAAVAAYNKRHRSKLLYLLIGDGEERNRIAEYIKTHTLEQYIVICGHIDDARTYLSALDLFLLPSLKEGMPYVILEAGAAGLPVIGSATGGVPEIIEHDVTGYLVDPVTVQSITTALETLTPDTALQERLGTALREKVRTQFSLAQMVSSTEAVYYSRSASPR